MDDSFLRVGWVYIDDAMELQAMVNEAVQVKEFYEYLQETGWIAEDELNDVSDS